MAVAKSFPTQSQGAKQVTGKLSTSVSPKPIAFTSPRTPTLPSAKPPTNSEIGEAEDAALLAAMAKKCQTMDPGTAEVIDPADYEGAHVLREEPKLMVIPNFLSDAEIEHILQLAEPKWQRTQVLTTGIKGAMYPATARNSSLRTNSGAPLNYGETQVIADVEQKICQLAGMDVNHLEKLILVRYEDGQQYKMHHDGHWRPITVFIYLNDLPEDAEGETFFPNLELKIKPRKGAAVMWPNSLKGQDGVTLLEDTRVMHAGLPPKGAIKYGINCFFNCAPKRLEDDHNSCIQGQGPPTASEGMLLNGPSKGRCLAMPVTSIPVTSPPLVRVQMLSPGSINLSMNGNGTRAVHAEARPGVKPPQLTGPGRTQAKPTTVQRNVLRQAYPPTRIAPQVDRKSVV